MVSRAEQQSRKVYWGHVEACLTRFHEYAEKDAHQVVSAYKRRFPITSNDPSANTIYHYEPFRIACDISGKKLSVKNFAEEYRQLLGETNFGVRVHLPPSENVIEATPKRVTVKGATSKGKPKATKQASSKRRKSVAKTQPAATAPKRPGTGKRKSAARTSSLSPAAVKKGAKKKSTKRFQEYA